MSKADAVSLTDEQILSRFSGRLDRCAGRFLGRPHRGRWAWDLTACAILGRPVGEPASLETLVRLVVADERGVVSDAFDAAIDHGWPVLVSCRIQAGDGQLRSVLITAEMMEAEPMGLSMTTLDVDALAAASGPWLAGQLIDLTHLRFAPYLEVRGGAADIDRQQAIIEQAKGMIMLTHRIDAAAALDVLRQRSETAGAGISEVAEQTIDAAQSNSPSRDTP